MTLVTNGRLITRDPEGQGYYEHGAVAYEGTKIVEIGEEAALRAKYPHLLRFGTGPFHRGQQPHQLLRGAGRNVVGH